MYFIIIMSNYKVPPQLPLDQTVIQQDDQLLRIPGRYRDADEIVISGSGGTVSGVSKLYVDTQDTALKAYIDLEIASLESTGYLAIQSKIETLKSTPPDVIVSTSGAADLASAVNSVTSGQTIEIRSSATFSPITVPSGVEFNIKVADGFAPSISGQGGIKLDNGAANVLISSLILEGCTTPYQNGQGSAITFSANHSKAHDITFHNITIRDSKGSGALLTYYSGSDYATAQTLDQMSHNISFIDCYFHKATTDKIEGGSLGLRGINGALIHGCYIDAANLGRGMHIQNCINTVVENCYVANCDDGNGGEGIKIDQLGTIVGYRNTATIRNNIIKRCIEGIDIDDITSLSIIQNNIVSECSGEGISVDDSGRAALINNFCYNNNRGIRLESGAITTLKKNVCYNNNTDYLIENGYTLDDSNTTSLDDMFIATYASTTKNDSTVSGATVKDALDEVAHPSGATGLRPSTPSTGQYFFDTTLGIPVWYNGSNWVSCSGTTV